MTKAEIEAQAKADRERIKNAKEYSILENKINKIIEKRIQNNGKLSDEEQKLLNKSVDRRKELEKELDIGEELLQTQHEILTSEEKSAALNYDINKSKEKGKDLLIKLDRLEKDKSKMSYANYKVQKDLLVNEVTRLKTNIDIATEMQEEEKLRKKMVDLTGDVLEKSKALVETSKVFVQTMMKNPLLAIGAAIMVAVKAMSFLNEKTRAFQEEIGGSVTQGKQLRNQLIGAQADAALLGYDATKTAGALVEEFGSIDKVSSETVKTLGRFEKGLGISAASSAKVMKTLEGLGHGTQEAQLNTMKFGAELAIANGVAPGKVMEDIAANTEAMAKFGGKSGKEFMKAAVFAKKLGLEISTMTKISDSLLDFETSIASEMEASMLIGKQLNFNKARELALSGDLEGATKSIMDQIGGAAEFQKLNVVQRQALADSMGVSVDELSKLATGGEMKLKAPDKTSEEQLKESMDGTQLAMMNLITAENALKVAVGILTAVMIANTLSQGKLGGIFGKGMKGMKGMFKGLGGTMATLGTTMTGAISGLGTKMTNLLGKGGKGVLSGAKALGKGAMSAGKGALSGAKALGKGAVSVGKGVLSGAKTLGKGAITGAKSVGKGLANVAGKGVTAVGKGSKALSTGIKTASKGVGKGLLKKIPGIGLVAGLGFAASRLMKGDALGALGEVASGAASIIPGIGTAVSTAIDVGMIARDASKAAKDTAETVKDTTKVQVKEREAIIQKEKSMSNLSKKQVEAKKAAEDAIVAQKKAVEKEKAKMVQEQAKKQEVKVVEQPKVKVQQPETRSKEELEAELAKMRALQQKQQRELFGPGSEKMRMGEKRRRQSELMGTNKEVAKLIKLIEEQTIAIREGSEKQVKATQNMVND